LEQVMVAGTSSRIGVIVEDRSDRSGGLSH
jgi:chemotaxis receptor (MCP) glutamine deamidase CheD